MKRVLALALCTLLSSGAFAACDENCKREQAMKEHNVSFPSYLTAKFCKTTSIDFLIRDVKSLQGYRDKQLPGGHKGGMNNIRKLLEKRKLWLTECDDYLRLTNQGRVFDSEATTVTIFASMDKVTNELNALIYNGDSNVIVTSGVDIVEQYFDHLFDVMGQHKTDLQLKGRL